MPNILSYIFIEVMFQSLFSWNLLLMIRVNISGSRFVKFQSLFSWNLLLMGELWRRADRRKVSFNPCFRGTCSWCLEAGSHRLGQNMVSILVFVELALDARPGKPQVLRLICFNPCFRGTCSWCASFVAGMGNSRSVSILVFVELALDGKDYRLCNIERPGFQSLFSWNLLLMIENYETRECSVPSFNPCFRGTCSWCSALPSYAGVWSGFNPCFRGTCSWCQWEVSQPLPGVRSFNPCFRGTCSWWEAFRVFRVRLVCFNPCFRGTCSWWSAWFGWWIKSIFSFNPCFRGTCSWWKAVLSGPNVGL